MSVVILSPLLWLIDTVINLYIAVVIAAVVASWLIAFGVLNLSNPLVRQLMQILDALTEPVFRRVRRIVPPIRGLDFSPLIVWIGLQFIQYVINTLFLYLMGRL
jgi:YggT family protein